MTKHVLFVHVCVPSDIKVPLGNRVVIRDNKACNGGVWAWDLLFINTLAHAPVLMLTDALSLAHKK